jgi:hypothetical protein
MVFLTGFLYGQELRGIIKAPNGDPLANVSVSGLDDFYKIVVFGLTDDVGIFRISYTSNSEPSYLFINHINYQPDTIKLFDRSDTIHIFLQERTYLLPEVKVEVDRQHYENSGDTTRYDVASFRDGHERSIEEVLSKLPGVKVSEEGIITFRGKTVSNVLIGYDDLFGKKYAIGTKSMSPEYIDEFEFIDKYEKEGLLQGISSSEQLVLNLKLKEDYKLALFGDTELGVGIPKRYLARGNLFSMSDSSKSVVISNFNNVAYEAFDLMNYIENGGSTFEDLNYQRSLNRLISGAYYSKTGLPFELQSLSNNNTISLNNISQFGPIKSDTKLNLSSITNRFNESNQSIFLGEEEEFSQNLNDTSVQKGAVIFNELSFMPTDQSKILVRSEISVQDFNSESIQELGKSSLNSGLLHFISGGNSFRQSYNVEYIKKLHSASVIKVNYTFIDEKLNEKSLNHIEDSILQESLGLDAFSQRIGQRINDNSIAFNWLNSNKGRFKTNLGAGVSWVGDKLRSSVLEEEDKPDDRFETEFKRFYRETFLESKILYNYKAGETITFAGRLSRVNNGIYGKFLYNLNLGYQSSSSSKFKMSYSMGYSKGLINAANVSNLRYYSDNSSLVLENSSVNLYENGFLLGNLTYSIPKKKLEIQWSMYGRLIRNVAEQTIQDNFTSERQYLGKYFQPSVNTGVSLDKYLRFIKTNFNFNVSYFRTWNKNRFNNFNGFESENISGGLVMSTNNIGFFNFFFSNKLIKNQFSSNFGKDGVDVRENFFFQTKYGVSVSPLKRNQLKFELASASYNPLTNGLSLKDNQFLEINSTYIVNERNNVSLMVKNVFNRNSFDNMILNPYSQEMTSVSLQSTFFYISYFFRFSS